MSKFYVFFKLLQKDLLTFSRQYKGKLFDTVLLFVINILVFAYLMSGDLKGNYGPFFAFGALATFGFVDIVGKISMLTSDIEGDRTISSCLIMPSKAWIIFLEIGCFWALSSFLLILPLFPLAKLLLWNSLDLSKISIIKLILILPISHLFFGIFALWLASIIKGLQDVGNLWLRVVMPLWMFGAYFFSWQSVYKIHPLVSYLFLLDPIVYVNEGLRSACLGSEGYLPFFFSFFALVAFVLLCGFDAIRRLKKRLDCV